MMDRASGCFATTPIFGQVRLMASRFGSCKAQNKKLAITNINTDRKIKATNINMKIYIWPGVANGKAEIKKFAITNINIHTKIRNIQI